MNKVLYMPRRKNQDARPQELIDNPKKLTCNFVALGSTVNIPLLSFLFSKKSGDITELIPIPARILNDPNVVKDARNPSEFAGGRRGGVAADYVRCLV